MKPLNLGSVGATAAVCLALGALTAALSVRSGSTPLLVTPWLSLLFVLIGSWLLVGGRGVRQLKARKDTWVTVTGATRIAVFSRAAAYVMAGCSGFLLGISFVSFTRMWAPAMAFSAWSGLAGGLTALFACVCGVVVERWCRDDGGDQDDARGIGTADPSAPRPRAN